ncbi:PCI domain containing protein [Histomonas meleagridis]|uniref:PCI domain containing protein n=1 Tax=Histomonas meleagridis TaxID=135588 RepID=UPI003559BE04|nr:PCI domain containing protein [Histomonas meleagridis]KAH0801664.1 PCI domain containing protein [Histomonas meleagridis]
MYEPKTPQQIVSAIRNKDGGIIATCFCIQHLRQFQNSYQALIGNNIITGLGGVWADALTELFQAAQAETEAECFEQYLQSISLIIREFSTIPPHLSVPCIISIAKSLRYFATNVDYNESVSQMQKLLKLALSIKTFKPGQSPLLAIVNELMAVYFMRNLYTHAEKLLTSVDNDTHPIQYNLFSKSDVSCFRFYKGRISAIKGELKEARDNLTDALLKCPLDLYQNRRLILLYLIPVQLPLGELPNIRDGFLTKYDLQIFDDFVIAIENGDLKLFDDAFERNQILFIKLGLFELMCKSRNVVYYQIFRMAHAQWNSEKVPVSVFQQSLSIFHPYTIMETESILCLLIEEKKVKAYIHYGLHIVVFSKEKAFVPLSECA